MLELCGENCVGLCLGLLEEGLSAGSVYVSPSAQQGLLDSQAFKTISEVSLTM